MDNIEFIGSKIKLFRKRKKISQEQLAEMISMNHRTIVRIENGHTIPTIETLQKISNALDLNITDFFETKTFNNKSEIIESIKNKLENMSFAELEKFYKIVCDFYE